jgi:wyosine [tRNA(Phe)-imidazoG37] synthetase (radical SAM superfamily)
MPAIPTSRFTAVYGPVSSWRYGRSLGIDPIGCVSTCSFNCVYCQLGEIEHKTSTRAIYVPTEQILEELRSFAPWDVDAITLSGSGEPTLALNLGEILQGIRELTGQLTLVLTNGTLLSDPEVRAALTLADKVSVKLDTISLDALRRINRPVPDLNLSDIWAGIQQFRAEFSGEMSIQTMLLFPWDTQSKAEYIRLMQLFAPDEIQLNTPTRPKPLKHQLEGRGNHSSAALPYKVQTLKCVSTNVLQKFAIAIHNATGIPVRCAPLYS